MPGGKGIGPINNFFDIVIDAITNVVGVMGFLLGEGIEYLRGGRISYYLFFYFSCVPTVNVILSTGRREYEIMFA